MRKLIIVRHGDYERCVNLNSRLSKEGRHQIGLLGEKIKLLCNGSSVLILSSTLMRARQSADILAKVLGINFKETEKLVSGGNIKPDCVSLFEYVQEWASKAEVIILVTHLEYAEDFPGHFGHKEFNVSFSYPSLSYGRGLVIDCESETCERL